MRRLLLSVLVLLAACTPQEPPVLPTLAVLPSATPPVERAAQVIVPVSTSEQENPLAVVTVDADFMIVTPTAPPSKTPTATETPTQTPTFTPSPTRPTTATATATALIPPTRVVPFITQPVTAVVVLPVDRVCDSEWFFIQPRPDHCPLTDPTVSRAVFQQFEGGVMVWVAEEDRVYAMYNDFEAPSWETFEDTYEDWMPETDADWEEPPQTWLYQPRRGFGTVWRTNAQVRERLGWANRPWEEPYSMDVQESDDGTIFLADPDGGVIALYEGQQDWERFIAIPTPYVPDATETVMP